MSPKLSIDDVKPEAKNAVTNWTVMADEKYRKKWFLFFAPINEKDVVAPSRPTSSSSASKKLALKNEKSKAIREGEKELERANWQTMYQVTNNSIGSSLEAVKKRAMGEKGKILKPLIDEIFKPSSKAKVEAYMAEMSRGEVDNFTILMRSLSIAYEAARTNFTSEYILKYTPKKANAESIWINDPFASSLSVPVTYAPPRQPLRPRSTNIRQATPQMSKPAPAPQPQEGLLEWGGGVSNVNSSYRTFFTKMGERYPDVIADKPTMSFACGRSIPDALVGDEHRNIPVFLPHDSQSMHILKQKKPTSQPSWHLLYKDGVVYSDKPGAHDPGELSIYKKDFTHQTTVVKAAKPTLDPFASSITISMSDYPYHGTTYQTTICRSAAIEYDRQLV
uniref:Uncharacterized protein n=1 Tax=Hemiselmis andersenii TaxID=464988 RepID=A0A7S1EDF7_HEMAN|mmetsp:Transcript_4237/g.10276  ORF Transcript_4237/g.10276 Transcript_4237/m.10276 type:complete len:392 (+) Transcript_4237:83-1258(+)